MLYMSADEAGPTSLLLRPQFQGTVYPSIILVFRHIDRLVRGPCTTIDRLFSVYFYPRPRSAFSKKNQKTMPRK